MISYTSNYGYSYGNWPYSILANLYLGNYKSKYKTNLMRRNKQFHNLFWFIDDLCALNDRDEFSKPFPTEYPTELELKAEQNGAHVIS